MRARTQALALDALQELMLLSDRLAADHAPILLAALRSPSSPPPLRLRAARAAGTLAAARPRHAPGMLAALEELLLGELACVRDGRGASGGDSEAAGAGAGTGGRADVSMGGGDGGDGSGGLAAAAAAVYAGAVVADSLVLSSSAHAALAACLLTAEKEASGRALDPGGVLKVAARTAHPSGAGLHGGAARACARERCKPIRTPQPTMPPSAKPQFDGRPCPCPLTQSRPQVSDIGAALTRHLLEAAPSHQQRKLLLGLLAHAPAPGGGAALARRPLGALLPPALAGGEELAAALAQALAGATLAAGASALGEGAAAAGAPPVAGSGAAGRAAGGGARGARRAQHHAELAEAAAAMLERAAPGPRAVAALLAHFEVGRAARGARRGSLDST